MLVDHGVVDGYCVFDFAAKRGLDALRGTDDGKFVDLELLCWVENRVALNFAELARRLNTHCRWIEARVFEREIELRSRRHGALFFPADRSLQPDEHRPDFVVVDHCSVF